MKSKWYVLLVIIFMYLPVSIDASSLYVVAPVLSSHIAGLSLYMLSDINFVVQATKAWLWMTLPGAGDTVALMASSLVFMSAAPAHKASSAGSIEAMSYELGPGLGITIFEALFSAKPLRLPVIWMKYLEKRCLNLHLQLSCSHTMSCLNRHR